MKHSINTFILIENTDVSRQLYRAGFGCHNNVNLGVWDKICYNWGSVGVK